MKKTAAQNRLAQGLDRIAWGLLDLRDHLVARGWWPACRIVAGDGAGARWVVRGTRAHSLESTGKVGAAAVAGDRCLWGQLTLPAMARGALPSAVNEALYSQSPLPPDQMLCAWRAEPAADGAWRVQWALVPRDAVVALRQTLRLGESAPTYLLHPHHGAWAVRDAAFARQRRRQAWWDAAALLALGMVVASAAALAGMPAALQRQGVVGAMQQLQTLEPQAAPIRQQLDVLRSQARIVEDIRAGHDAAVPAASIIEALAAALPDDTVLDRIDILGRDIRISGLTPNATDLLSRVAGHGAFADAKAPNAAVRDPGSNKERFTFELRWKGGGVS